MIFRNKKEKKKDNKTIYIMLVITLLLLLICGILYYFNRSVPKLEVTFEGAQINHEFDMDVLEYNLYTTSDSIKINCNLDIEGCNKTIILNSGDFVHTLTFNSKTYTFNIIKLIEDETEEEPKISILEIYGIPEKWVKQVQLEVVVYNPKYEKIYYSFDNGNTYQEDNKLVIKKNGSYTIKIKNYYDDILDSKEVEINKIDNTPPVLSIVQEKKNDNEVLLTAFASDNMSGIKSYLWSNGSTEKAITVTKNGEYTVEVVDNLGNKSSNSVTVTSINSNQVVENTYSVIFESNGANQESIALSCSTDKESCEITTPSITREGYTIIGWSLNRNATTADVRVNQKIRVNSNLVYYAITSKVVTATFNKNGATSISSTSASCTKYNTSNSCIIKLPNIVRSGFIVHGWSTNKNDKSGIECNTNVELSTNTTYYAITSKTITIKFNKNGNMGQTPHNGIIIFDNEVSEYCDIYNTATSCAIYSPTIKPLYNTMTPMGYTLGTAVHSDYWTPNTKKNVSENKIYYAQSKRDLTATFEKNGAESISYTTKSCSAFNTVDYCHVVLPTITRRGFTIHGWSTTQNDNTGIAVSSNVKLTKNTVYYAITSKEITVSFYKNGNMGQTGSNGIYTTSNSISEKCVIRNTNTSCSITPPTIRMDNYTIHGYSTGSTTYSNYWKDTPKSFSNNAAYYAQTSKTVVITFDKNTTFDNNVVPKTNPEYDWSKTNIAASSLSFYSRTCLSRNNNGCKITKMPIIYSAGNEVQGFSYTATGGIYRMLLKTFKQDTTLYARVYNNKSKGNFHCANCSGTPTKVGNYVIEYETTTTAAQRTEYNRFMQKVYAKMPQLFYARGKVRALSADSFHEYWGNYGGITGGFYEYPKVDVYNFSVDHFKGALVHELGHAMDRYYSLKSSSGNLISQEADILQLIDDCNADSSQCGFVWGQENDYSNNLEFVANLFHVYYYNIADEDGKWTPSHPENLVMSNRVKNIVEKYLRIIKNFPDNL